MSILRDKVTVQVPIHAACGGEKEGEGVQGERSPPALPPLLSSRDDFSIVLIFSASTMTN